MILKQIAQKISEDTTKIIGFPVSISDEEGYLIGVNDLNRIGLYDNLFAEVIKANRFIYFNESAVKDFPNIFPGVAAPINVNEKIIGAVGIIGKTGKDTETKNYIKLVKNHIEMICHETIKKEVKSLESNTLDTLIQYVLNFDSHKHDEKQIIRYGKMLGYDFNIDRVCIVIKIMRCHQQQNDEPTLQMHDEILEELTEYFLDHNEDLIGRLTFEEFCILKHIDYEGLTEKKINKFIKNTKMVNKILKSKYGVYANISIGNITNGIQGLQNSYYNALQTIDVNSKLNNNNRFSNYNDLTNKLHIIINELPNDFFDRIKPSIRPLIEHENYDVLANTFIVYCESKFNLSDAARNLFIHRNSLIYRLNQFTNITKITLSDFNHCILVYLYLKINSV